MAFDPLPQQCLAIEAPLGPVLVVAGPGAGKTFCLIARINYLIDALHVAPERICAVTFTNRAAEEIAIRLKHTLGERAEPITRGTIHALCLALLREHAEAAGLQKGFGVAEEQYQKAILGRLHVPQEPRGSLLNRFSRHRVQKRDYELTADDARLYREYAAWLAHRNMLDFDDLVSKAEELLRTHGDIADAVAARWDYLLVDEFQDVNAVQYDLLKRLAAPHGNFFAVGDDEQSIFTWTGADPYVLVRFSREYAIDRPIVLDKNCRCSRQIFETARRVLAHNPQLFEKQLSADQESAYDVGAFAFRDEEEEASWLLDDILADRTAAGLEWGDYAILYRRHKLGEYLEGRLVRAGIPCRLARGRALVEDDVIKYVMAALRIVRDPGDPVALEAFARCVLSAHFLQEVLASFPFPLEADFLAAIRTLARRRPAQDPDTKKLWRLVFQVENLRALPRSHRTLAPLVDEILSQSVGPYRNALEERHDELTDPADSPEAVRLAEHLAGAIAAERDIVIEPQDGLEIALRGMLIAAGVRHVPSSTNLHQPPPTSIPSPLILFKALQLLHARELDTALERYVTFDLETTDKDVEVCEVVEIGAVRVVGGEIVDRFHSLVRPYRPITPGATKVHGYTDGDVRNARPFAEVWPEFRAFIGDDVLIAHNGQHFDIPVLRRLAAGREGVDTLVFYDTLPLVRSLSRDSAKLEDLALRFGIDAGRAHHALDDAVTLARVYRELERLRAVRARKAVLVNLLDYLGLAFALECERERGALKESLTVPGSREQEILFKVAKFYTLGRYSDALAFYEMERERSGGDSGPSVDEVIRRLGGRALMTRLRAEPDPAQRYPAAVARLRALIDEPAPAEPASPPDPLSTTWASPPNPLSTTWRGGTLKERIDRLLDRVALSTSEGIEVAPDRVNLLTLHSTKGLEFSRVYIVGVEDYQIPGLREATEHRQAEIQEARRLLYVGMTRTRERLVLTRVERRFGMEAGGSSFLEEIGLEADAVGAG